MRSHYPRSNALAPILDSALSRINPHYLVNSRGATVSAVCLGESLSSANFLSLSSGRLVDISYTMRSYFRVPILLGFE